MIPGAGSPAERLQGLIERVTFQSPDSGFAVLRVKVKGQRDLVTVVGTAATANPGEWITAEGRWVRDREHGQQFKAERMQSAAPTSREGMEKYLGSGLIKGIGAVYAAKMVERFGESVFDVIEKRSAELESIPGIGSGRRKKIREAWAEQKVIREIMVFLHSNGVSTSRAVRVFKTYGEESIAVVRENPYRLARDIPGIGFKTADKIALQSGVPADSIMRARAALEYILFAACDEGHAALPERELIERTGQLLQTSHERIDEAKAELLLAGELIREQIDGEDLLFLPRLLAAEEGIADRLAVLVRRPAKYPAIDADKAIAWCEQTRNIRLAPHQKEAIRRAMTQRALVITGGPGVGKTTLVDSILSILRAKKVRCLLCAPTGRAARRMQETTGLEAVTIHRLLEYRAGEAAPGRNRQNPVECDLLVADEVSMIDLPLMHRLLQALPDNAHLLLIGDVDQLPSVGPGTVLRDVIQSGLVPVVRLTEVFRQAAESKIVTNAHLIHEGRIPEPGEPDEDFHVIAKSDSEEIESVVVRLVRDRIPAKLGCHPIRDIQVLTPMNRGKLGARNLNAVLQDALNPAVEGGRGEAVERFGWQFRVRDKVMQTRNNYDKEVFNGDIGFVKAIDTEEREVRVRFDSREVVYDLGELDELSPAYAVTVHKAQGSEFPAVVMPLAMQHYLLLQRNLLYTGVTRGKRLVVLAAETKALAVAVARAEAGKRYGGLLTRLRKAAG